jgi:hypothetical protein
MKSTGDIGLKIGLATREFYRYQNESADLERRGAGISRPELAWATRFPAQEENLCSQPKKKTA